MSGAHTTNQALSGIVTASVHTHACLMSTVVHRIQAGRFYTAKT